MVLALRSEEHSVCFIEDQKENEVWWIQYKVMMPTDMKHAHRYSKDKASHYSLEHRISTVLSAEGELKSEWVEQAVRKSIPVIA